MKFTLSLESVFRYILGTYDAISPSLIANDFEATLGERLVRAHIDPPKKEIFTLDMLSAFNRAGEPVLALSAWERHFLATPAMVVAGLLDTGVFPTPAILAERMRGFVGYKNTSAGSPHNALTYYLCGKALHFVGLQTGEGAGDVDLLPLELTLGLKSPAP